MGWIIGMIAIECFWGAITYTINKNKGYDGGFAWGFFLGLIGVIVVVSKTDLNNNNDYIDSNALGGLLGNQDSASHDNTKLLDEGGWRCAGCGRVNANYAGTCGCGMSKQQSKEIEGRKTNQNVENSINLSKTSNSSTGNSSMVASSSSMATNDADIISTLKSYKELVDQGVITQEEFEKKKKQLLGIC